MERCCHLENILVDENLCEGWQRRRYLHGKMMQYHLVNASIAIPNHLNVYRDTDGYDFIALENIPGGVSPMKVTIKHQLIEEERYLMIQTQEHFRTYMMNEIFLKNNLVELKEVNIDGYFGMMLQKDFGIKGSQTSLILVVNKRVVQVSVLFNECYSNTEEVAAKILNSFHLYFPEDPVNASDTFFKVTLQNHEEEKVNLSQKIIRPRFNLQQWIG